MECYRCGETEDKHMGVAPCLENYEILHRPLCASCDEDELTKFESAGYVFKDGSWKLIPVHFPTNDELLKLYHECLAEILGDGEEYNVRTRLTATFHAIATAQGEHMDHFIDRFFHLCPGGRLTDAVINMMNETKNMDEEEMISFFVSIIMCANLSSY